MCISRFLDYKENLQSKILKRWVIMKEHMIMIRTYGNVIMGKLENHKENHNRSNSFKSNCEIE